MADRITEFEYRLNEGRIEYLDESAFLELIEACIGDQRWETALAASAEGLAQHPFSLDIMCARAAVLLEIDQPDRALTLMNQAAGIAPGEFDVSLLQIEALIELGRTQDAATMIGPLLDAYHPDEDMADLWYFQSIIEEQHGHMKAMHQSLEKAVWYNTRFYEALERMWLSTELLGNYETSITYYEKIIDKDPYSWQVWYNLGHAHACMENYEAAAEAFEYACIIDEEQEHPWRDQGEMRMQTGEFDRAIECFIMALDKSEERSSDLLTRLGDAYEKAGKRQLAIEALREAIKYNPQDDDALYNYGCIQMSEREYEDAIVTLEQAIAIQNEKEEYFVALAEAYFQTGRMGQAEMCLHSAIELAPEQAGYWLHYASMLLHNGELAEALELLEEALSQQHTPQLDYARIACLFRLGKRQEACQSLCLQLAEDFNAHETLFAVAPELSADPDVISLVRAFRLDA